MLLSAGGSTALAAITVITANEQSDTRTLVVAAGWWTIALVAGLVLGRPGRRRGRDARGPRQGAHHSHPAHRQPRPGWHLPACGRWARSR